MEIHPYVHPVSGPRRGVASGRGGLGRGGVTWGGLGRGVPWGGLGGGVSSGRSDPGEPVSLSMLESSSNSACGTKRVRPELPGWGSGHAARDLAAAPCCCTGNRPPELGFLIVQSSCRSSGPCAFLGSAGSCCAGHRHSPGAQVLTLRTFIANRHFKEKSRSQAANRAKRYTVSPDISLPFLYLGQPVNIDGKVEYPSYLQSLRDFEPTWPINFKGCQQRFVVIALPKQCFSFCTFREQTDSSATSLTKRRVMIVVLTYSLSN